MATKKLSQITPASAAPALTDQVVGVTTGTIDNLFTVSQLATTTGGRPIATSNLNFYVATTGSDSNNGTSPATPFFTVQKGLTAASLFDYQDQFFPTVNIAAGTYNTIAPNFQFQLPPMVGVGPNLQPTVLGSIASPNTVIIHDVAGIACFFAVGSQSFWVLKGLLFKTDGYAVHGQQGSATGIFTSNFTSDTANGLSIFHGEQDSTLNINGTTININSVQNFNIADLGPTARVSITSNTIALQPNTVWNGNDTVHEASQYRFINNTITNILTSTGGGINLRGESSLVTNNGQAADLPYTGAIAGDEGSSWVGNQNNKGGLFANKQAGAPTTSFLGPGIWGLFKDTNLGGVTTAYNDAGTIRILNRVRLSAATSFFVSTTGSNTTGDGSAGNPWLTQQFAANYIAANYDLGGQTIRIIAQAGSPNTYGGVPNMPSFVGGGKVEFDTSDGVIANTVIAGGALSAFQSNTNTASATTIALGGFTMQCSEGSGPSILTCRGDWNWQLGTTTCPNVGFGVCGDGFWQILVDDFAIIIDTIVSVHCTITPQVSGANGFIRCQGAGQAILQNNNYVIVGTPAWSSGFLSAAENGGIAHTLAVGTSVTGASTGPRWLLEHGGLLFSGVAVASIPGNAVGTTINAFNVRNSDTPINSMELIQQAAFTVANLPAASSWIYTRAMVLDANATTFNSIVAGLGANIVPVFSDGTNWRIG